MLFVHMSSNDGEEEEEWPCRTPSNYSQPLRYYLLDSGDRFWILKSNEGTPTRTTATMMEWQIRAAEGWLSLRTDHGT